MLRKYFWNLLVALDQFVNTVLFGDPDETISSRLGKWLDLPQNTWRYNVASFVCKILRRFDENHCKNSIEKDEGDKGII